MRERITFWVGPAAAAALVCAAIAPATSGAAAVELNRACYLEGSRVGLSAAGFAPGSKVDVRRGGTLIGSTTADAVGGVEARFDAPKLPAGRREASAVIELSDGTTRASTRLPITRFHASFSPATGDPATMLVRFSVDGFGLLDAQPNVYVHYVGPERQGARDRRAGHGPRRLRPPGPDEPAPPVPVPRAGRAPGRCSSTRASATARAASTGPASSSSRAA